MPGKGSATVPVQKTVEDQARERFERDTDRHEMTVLRDDGLYRHVRFQEPGSSFYWYDLVTWPGVLTISGDAGCFVFSRTRDMFEFFDGMRGGINPGYWAEKLRAPRHDAARSYSEDRFRSHVLEWYEDIAKEMGDAERTALRAAIDDELLGELVEHNDYEDGARRLLSEFEHEGTRIYDPGDWDLREWDWSFLWCCWAIVDGIKRYRERAQVSQ